MTYTIGLIGYVKKDEGGLKCHSGAARPRDIFDPPSRALRALALVTFLTRLRPSVHNQLKPIVTCIRAPHIIMRVQKKLFISR